MSARRLICLVTDRRRLGPGPSLDPLVDFLGAASRAGVDMIQIRERDLSARQLAALAECTLDRTAGTGCRVVVNDRTDVALSAHAHGVHLRADSLSASRVRGIVPEGFVIGRSVHSHDEAIDADRDGADYLIFGAVFSSASKPGQPPAGLDDLARAVAAVRAPVLAIGGMTPERAGEAVRAGAAGVAAIGMFVPPASIGAERYLDSLVRDLRGLFDTR